LTPQCCQCHHQEQWQTLAVHAGALQARVTMN